jgi:hypothetical protein
MRILLNYELIPESNSVYLLEVDEETGNRIVACHNKYTNLVDMTSEDDLNLDWLYEFIQDKTPVFNGNSSVFNVTDCVFVQSGFIL